MIKTWSLEEALIRAQSALAVAVQGVWDVFTNRPAYSNQHRILGCPNASDCRDHGCAGDCSEAVESPGFEDAEPAEQVGQAEGQRMATAAIDGLTRMGRDDEDDTPNPYEPGLTDDELVAVRGLIQERYETSAVVPRNGPAEHPAGGLTHSPESPQPVPQLDWHGWAEPAVTEVLAEHYIERPTGLCRCGAWETGDLGDWREHVAELIASRLACDPARAIAALHNHRP